MHPIVRTFRTNIVEGRFFSLLASVFVIAVRWILYHFGNLPKPNLIADNYLYNEISHLFIQPHISLIFSTLSIFIIAYILSYMNNRFGITRTRSNLPYVIPLFLFSLHPYFLMMNGSYIAIIFILIAFFPLLESYQKSDPYLYSFRSAILIAVASLFQIQALFLVPLWWRGEFSMRGPQFRSFISSLFGVVLIYTSTFAIYYFSDNIEGFLIPFNSFYFITFFKIPDFTTLEWIISTLVFSYFITIMILSVKAYSREKVLSLAFMQFLQFLIIFMLLLQIIYWSKTIFFLNLSVALVSFLSAYFYTKTSSKGNILFAYITLLLFSMFYLSHLFTQILFSF